MAALIPRTNHVGLGRASHSRSNRLQVKAVSWTQSDRNVGSDRSRINIRADGQPILAPRTEEMRGDPFGSLLRQRTIFMGGEVEDFSADALVSQLLLLDSQDQGKDIKLFINSPGGSVSAGMGIYDAMMLCRSDVSTYCFGLAASMGAFLLGAGKRGKRYSMPNSRIMIHQPLGGASGQAVDIEIQAKEIMYHKANLNRIIADYTLQPLSKIEEDTDRDRYMSPIEAKEYGLIDQIVGGEDAVFNIKDHLKKFQKPKEEIPDDETDQGQRTVAGGDPFMASSPNGRFRSQDKELFLPSQYPGSPLFNVRPARKQD